MPTGTALHDRLRSVAGERSYRVLADLTGTNSETVRRYMTGQAPSIEFVTAFCRVFRVNHEWLLTGKGPARARELRGAVLSEASVSELLDALARSLEQLTERVERLERFVHTLETRLRVGGAPAASVAALREGMTIAAGAGGAANGERASRGDNGDAAGGGSTDGTQACASESRNGVDGNGNGNGLRHRDGNGVGVGGSDECGHVDGVENGERGVCGGGMMMEGVDVRVRSVADAVAAKRPRPGAG